MRGQRERDGKGRGIGQRVLKKKLFARAPARGTKQILPTPHGRRPSPSHLEGGRLALGRIRRTVTEHSLASHGEAARREEVAKGGRGGGFSASAGGGPGHQDVSGW